MGLKPDYRVRLIGAGIILILLAVLAAGCSSPTPIGVTGTPSPAPSATPATTATPSPVATPTVLPTATPSPSPSPTPTPVPGIVQSYQWLYKGKLYQFQLSIPQSAADHYRGLPHSAGSGYGAYGISSLDRPYLPADTLKSAVQSNGFGVSDAAMLVQAFVQSLQNTPGRDDSPKYPVETVLDKGGDSEDTSILAAALLNDMGFDAVLLSFPGHMAVGVKGTGDLYGRCYTYNGADYYYLETAIPGYEFGAIPDEYRNLSTTIYTLSSATAVAISATSEQASEDQLSVYYKVRCTVANVGSETARGVSVHFTSLALNYGPEQEWQISAQDVSVGDLAAGESRTVEATVKVPRSGDTQLECIVSGDNFGPAVWKGAQFTL